MLVLKQVFNLSSETIDMTTASYVNIWKNLHKSPKRLGRIPKSRPQKQIQTLKINAWISISSKSMLEKNYDFLTKSHVSEVSIR